MKKNNESLAENFMFIITIGLMLYFVTSVGKYIYEHESWVKECDARFDEYYQSQASWVQSWMSPTKYSTRDAFFIGSAYNYCFTEKEREKLDSRVKKLKKSYEEYHHNKNVDELVYHILDIALKNKSAIDIEYIYESLLEKGFKIEWVNGAAKPDVIRTSEVPIYKSSLRALKQLRDELDEKIKRYETMQKLRKGVLNNGH